MNAPTSAPIAIATSPIGDVSKLKAVPMPEIAVLNVSITLGTVLIA